MKVEKVKEENGELELSITASPEEVDKAFTDGLDVFIDQFQLRSLEGETALQKIYNAMSPEEARDAVSSAVISYLIPFALDQENIIPMTSSSVDAESDPVEGKEFTFNVTILPKPEFELTSYDPVEVSVLAPLDVTEQDIDMQMHMLASQFATVKVDPETGEEETIIPEVTDEWVETNLKGMGVTTVEELRKQFRATSEKVKEEQLDSAKANAVMAEWAKRFDGEVSPKMVDAMTTDMLEGFKMELAQQGKTLMDFMLEQKTDEKQIRASLAAQAEAQLINGFVFDAIFRHEGLELEVDDLKHALTAMAPGQEEEVFDQLQNAGRAFLLKEGASRMKAANWAMHSAKITLEEREA